MLPTNLVIVGLVLLAFAAFAVAAVSGLLLIERREVLARASGDSTATSSIVLRDENTRARRVKEWMERVGKQDGRNEALQSKLVMAGYDQPGASAIYFVLRVASMVLFPLFTLLIMPQERFALWALMLVFAIVLGLILPVSLLDRTVRLRQERIRRSVPDALDLLVVCVEAGVSLDAAILRVAKEIRLAHIELAYELRVVNRLTNAGITREAALRGLWQRTGVEDLRALVSSLIQNEKWGTSVATVLRVSADTLRRKRRQAAEKQAKMAPLKMTFPLILFILPALFAVIFGPAVVVIIREFGKL